MIEQVIGKSLEYVLTHWLHLPNHHGGIHDMDMWYFKVNARMDSIDVVMGIDSWFYLVEIIYCIM